MSDIKLKAASGGGSISLKGPSTLGSDRDLVDTSGNINLLDGQNLIAGTGNDLKIRHDGTNNHIEGLNGSTNIGAVEYINLRSTDSNGSNAKWMIRCHNDAEVSLYHNNTLQCETSANGLAFPSGKGIDFSATSDNAGKSSELLDDYEEGVYQPTVTGHTSGSWNVTSYTYLSYTKIGRLVHIGGYLNISSESSPSGDVYISLPFAVADLSQNAEYGAITCSLRSHGGSNLYNMVATITSNNSIQVLAVDGSGTATWLNDGHIGSAWNVRLGGCYASTT